MSALDDAFAAMDRARRERAEALAAYDAAAAAKVAADEALFLAEQAWKDVQHAEHERITREALEATPPDFARRDAAALVNAALLADAGTPKDAS